MSVYKWPVKTNRETWWKGFYWEARYRDPLFVGMVGTGLSEGEAIKDLKQVRREFIHWHEEDLDILPEYRKMTTNGRSK